MTVVKTIGTGTGLNVTPDYSTFAAYMTYLTGLGTFADDQVGRILWASSANELPLTAANTTINIVTGSFRLYLEAGDANGNAGGSFRDNPNRLTNALRYNASNGACIRQTGGTTGSSLIYGGHNITIRNLQFANSTNDGSQVINVNANNCVLDNCIIDNRANSTVTSVLTVQGSNFQSTNTLYLVTDSSAAGCRVAQATGTGAGAFTNCVFAITDPAATGGGGWVQASTGVVTFLNCAFYTAGADYSFTSGTTPTMSYCATNKTSGASTLPGTNHQYSLVGATEWQSVTQGSEDFRLASTSVKLRNNGTSAGAPAVDIVGTTRPL